MKVFISWSGERSHALANAVCEWLRPILHFAEPWLSSADIQSGDRWGIEVAKNLQDTNFGILCVTSDNINAPWLLFEAGALAKSIDDGRVIPLLLDLEKSDLSGPLTQFQAEKADRDGVRKLAESLNKAAPTAIPADTLSTLFEALWPQLEIKIAEIPTSASPQKKLRPQNEVLEELVAGVRSVEARVRDFSEEDDPYRRRRRSKFFPPMVQELVHSLSRKRDDPIQLVIFGSFLRDDIPWLYELAMLAYRAIKSGEIVESKRALEMFQRGLQMTMHGPFGRELGYDRERLQMVMMEMDAIADGDLIERFAVKARAPRLRKPRQTAEDGDED